MRIGILETGRPPEALAPKYGLYTEMFETLLRPHLPERAMFEYFAILDGKFPDSPDSCDVWLITGSAFSTYDADPWIARLQQFLKESMDAGTTMVGICFGHQMLAQALGGSSGKYAGGWGVGAHRYTLQDRSAWPVWLDAGEAELFDTYVSHQDQVSHLPPGATLLASSVFCENAMFCIGDQVLAMQCHPEMPSDFVRDLYASRRDRIGDGLIDAALDSIADTELAPDGERVARWIGSFIQHSLAKRVS